LNENGNTERSRVADGDCTTGDVVCRVHRRRNTHHVAAVSDPADQSTPLPRRRKTRSHAGNIHRQLAGTT